jgi:hypothetical protein
MTCGGALKLERIFEEFLRFVKILRKILRFDENFEI